MGVTREQKAKAEASRQRARLDREAREAAERKIVGLSRPSSTLRLGSSRPLSALSTLTV